MTRTYASDLGQLRALRQFVRSVCQREWSEPRDETALDKIVLAIQEAATNVIRHAYDGLEDGYIRVVVDATADQIRVSLFDNGKSFDRKSVSAPATDGTQLGGWGIFLIEQLVDDVSYCRDEQGRNEIRMTRRRSRHAT